MTESPPPESQPPPQIYIHPRREPFEHGLIPLQKLIFTDGSQTLIPLRDKFLQSSVSNNRINSAIISETLGISDEHARLVIDIIASVLHSDSDPVVVAKPDEVDSVGVNVYDLIIFLYIQSYKRLLPRGHKDSAAVADVWPSTSAFDGFLSALTPLQQKDGSRFLGCQLCYSQMHNILPTCWPKPGGRLYCDGCFIRVQNFSFFEEYTGPHDTIVCGNTTRKSTMFQDSTRQAVMKAVTDALRNRAYFSREEVITPGSNDSVYVMAQCWNTLSPDSCRACLVNAYASITTCLPWSEGRALNTGCFMRYSDTNFLNPIQTTRSASNKGKRIAIVVSAVSSVVVFTVALMSFLYIRKRRYIQQRRNGSYEAKNAKKLAKILTDSNLNFKYSTIEKATGNWNDFNKLGQGGFGTVYKGVLFDGREIAVKRLFLNNKFRAADFC